jgi:trehalose synthase-fused probable maltokinase
MTPARLAAARWFRSKQRPIASMVELDRARLPPADLVVAEVAFADAGPTERYLLVDPDDGRGAWSAIAGAMADGADLPTARGRFICRATGAVPIHGPLDERPLGVEQSNTSVVLGERLILKLYRLLEPGENPDVEVSAFLTDAGFADTPAVAGTMSWVPEDGDGDAAAAAMLQAFVPSVGDGWSTMLAALDDVPDRATAVAAGIGSLTARLHAALASRPDHPAFPARVATTMETGDWRASAEAQLAQAVASVSGEAHDRLVEIAPAIRARFADAFGRATGDEVVTRIHGDYHLGQLLARRDGGFSVIDFEGEPARPLAERRRSSSPLRDVAGMLRSLDYAARTADRAAAMAAATWLPHAREAFLGAYGVRGPLVEAFEVEKACYEVRYEANNRPDWLWLPLAALERLVAQP